MAFEYATLDVRADAVTINPRERLLDFLLDSIVNYVVYACEVKNRLWSIAIEYERNIRINVAWIIERRRETFHAVN